MARSRPWTRSALWAIACCTAAKSSPPPCIIRRGLHGRQSSEYIPLGPLHNPANLHGHPTPAKRSCPARLMVAVFDTALPSDHAQEGLSVRRALWSTIEKHHSPPLRLPRHHATASCPPARCELLGLKDQGYQDHRVPSGQRLQPVRRGERQVRGYLAWALRLWRAWSWAPARATSIPPACST